MGSTRVYVDHLRNVELFSELSRKELGMVAAAGQHLSVKQGTCLVEQDDARGYDAFVVLSGSVQLKRNGRVVRVVGPGALIGELSLIDQGPRTATATCVTDCEIFVLSRGSFLAAIEGVTALRHKLLASLASRVRELDKRAM